MIRCFQPRFGKKELSNLETCLNSGVLASGPFVEEFERRFAEISKKRYNVGFNSGSSAALAIFAFLKEKYGACDVYAPSLSFSSPIWAAVNSGHKIVFLDISKETFSTSQEHLQAALERTKNKSGRKTVIFPVLYGGISSIDLQHMDDTAIIVDSSHTVNPTMNCDFIFFSFHPVKPIAMGNGGIAATDDTEAAEFFRRFRNFGRVPLGISYDVVQTGFNFYMNDLNAAIGLGQLEVYKENMERRKVIAEIYNKTIDKEKYDIVRQVDSRGESSYYLYTVVTKHSKDVAGLMSFLRGKGIEAIVHYPLVHKLSFFSTQMPLSNLKNSEQVENRFINIPCHAAMKARETEFVAETLNEYADGV